MSNREADIIEQIKTGNEEGFRSLFELYYTPLCVYALKYIYSFEKVEDIVQEVFIHFWEKQRAKQISSNLKGYLFKAVKNNSLNYLHDANRYNYDILDN